MLVAQFAPHPIVDALWTSRRWLRRWGTANEWYEDWQERRDLILRRGLPAHIEGAVVEGDFFSIHLRIDEEFLVRSHTARGFRLHITLGYVTDWRAGTAEEAAERINAKWRGLDLVLKISWMGSGGAAFLSDDEPLALDWDVAWLHHRGYYADRGLHVSL